MPDELWTEVRDIVQETGIKTIPMEKKCKKAKWLSGEALQIAVKRREVKSKGEKERYKHLNAEFQRIARRDKKAFLSDQCKEIEENNRMGKTRDLFKKIRDTKGTFHAKMSSIKDRNGMDKRRRKWQPTPVFLPGKFHGQRSLVKKIEKENFAPMFSPALRDYSNMLMWNKTLQNINRSPFNTYSGMMPNQIASAGATVNINLTANVSGVSGDPKEAGAEFGKAAVAYITRSDVLGAVVQQSGDVIA